MKKFIVLLLTVLLFASCESKVDKAVRLAAEEINKSCPFFVDDNTRAESVEIDENGFFHYTYSFPYITKEEINIPEFHNTLYEKCHLTYNTNETMEIFKKNNVLLKYTYIDKNNEQIISFIIGSD